MVGDSSTIAEGKEFLRNNWEIGTNCPCCLQHVQLYNHALNGTMVRSLIELYKLDKRDRGSYFHVSKFEAWRDRYGGGQFAKVRYWGLAVDRDNDDEDKHASGEWAITQKGRDFVEREIKVPSHVRIFDSKSYGFKGKHVYIDECLGKRFSYLEVMGNYYPQSLFLHRWSRVKPSGISPTVIS